MYSSVDKPIPLFEKWLNDLFDESDHSTVQEMFGYLLVPTTAVQEAFILVGPGDAGKSVIGTILAAIFGNAFVSVNLHELVQQRFMLSVAENKLVLYDDDLGAGALKETGILKKLVAGDSPIPGERKYVDPYNFIPYCKLVMSTNIMLSALYDDSDGFFRRLYAIEVKPKNPDRKQIRKFGDKIIEEEREQIIRWALVGLKRLMSNGWKIAKSERSVNYMGIVKSTQVNVQEFVDECTVRDSESVTPYADIRKTYERWARADVAVPLSERRMQTWLSQNSAINGWVRNEKIPVGNGRRIMGYSGVKIKDEWKTSLSS
jgi:P4 family phage/plasmid primase-like protien